MKTPTSTEIIWQLDREKAIDSEFGKIQAEHFYIGHYNFLRYRKIKLKGCMARLKTQMSSWLKANCFDALEKRSIGVLIE
jgi:hypothetical protein